MNKLNEGDFIVLMNGKRANTLACVARTTRTNVLIIKILRDGTVKLKPTVLVSNYAVLNDSYGWSEDIALLEFAIETWKLNEGVKRLTLKFGRRNKALDKRNQKCLLTHTHLHELIEI